MKILQLLFVNRYLLLAFPWALVTGPFLPDLIICLSGLLFLIISLYRRYWNYYRNKFIFLFLIFYFFLLVRSFFTVDIWLSLESSLFYFRYLFFVLAVWYCSDNSPNFIKQMSYSGMAALSFVSLDALLQYFTGYNLLLMEQSHPLRVSGFFNDELILGSFLSRLLPIFFGLYLFSHNINTVKQLILSCTFLILVDISVFIAGERTAFFNLLMFTVGIIILSTKNKLLISISSTISLAIISILLHLNPVHQERMINLTIEQMGLESKSKLLIFSDQHQAHYMTAYKMFDDNKIFGQGPNMFRKLCSNDKFNVPNACSTHPHNIYLELLSEGGLMAFTPVAVLFIYLVLILYRHFWTTWIKNEKSFFFISDSRLCLILSLFITLWPLIPSNSFFTNNWIGGIYYLPIGFLLSKTLFKKNI